MEANIQLNHYSRVFTVEIDLDKKRSFTVEEITNASDNKKSYTIQAIDKDSKPFENVIGNWLSKGLLSLPAIKGSSNQ
jgi:hypothetical protein